MIFVTVGTEKFPFDRLLKAIHNAKEQGRITEEITAQIGVSKKSYPLFQTQKFFDFDEQIRLMKKADIIVAHAGIGSMLASSNLGKVPIFFPRQKAFGEHFDNHQMELAEKVATLGKAIVAFTDDDLIDKIIHYKDLLENLQTTEDDQNKTRLINCLRQICSPRAHP